MGVDFFSCDHCGDSICDCSIYKRCNEDCYRRWCDERCAAGDGYDPETETCRFCRDEDAEDSDLLRFLLRSYNLTREEVVKKFYEASDDNGTDPADTG